MKANVELWVCFAAPSYEQFNGAHILSFLKPCEEDELRQQIGDRLMSGRERIERVRGEAREACRQCFTRPPAVGCADGMTLRRSLLDPEGMSRWWYHEASFKDTTNSSTYTNILRLFAVMSVIDELRPSRVVLFCANDAFYGCLKQKHPNMVSLSSRREGRFELVKAVLRGLMSRLRFVVRTMLIAWFARRTTRPAPGRFDVLLQGYVDWSFTIKNGEIDDRYFTTLPAELARIGLSTGWLARYAPFGARWVKPHLIAAAQQVEKVILMERYFRYGDIFRESLDFMPLMAWLKFARAPVYRAQFKQGGLDLFPLFKPELVHGFLNGHIPLQRLNELACREVFAQTRPGAIVTFLEFFPDSRSVYAAAQKAACRPRCLCAQHAVYCSEKLFGRLDPDLELRGLPDGCPVPAPEMIFSMGMLAQELWVKCGYARERAPVTGGLRYQKMSIRAAAQRRWDGIRILLIGGMNEHMDFEMCESVCAAAGGIRNCALVFRDHPAYIVSNKPGFQRFKGNIRVSAATADEDLQSCDLVMTTHSSMAEEALLIGAPVWLWRCGTYCGSVLAEFDGIPSFCSVKPLHEALGEFQRNPQVYRPSFEQQRKVLELLYGPSPAQAGEVIADKISAALMLCAKDGAEEMAGEINKNKTVCCEH